MLIRVKFKHASQRSIWIFRSIKALLITWNYFCFSFIPYFHFSSILSLFHFYGGDFTRHRVIISTRLLRNWSLIGRESLGAPFKRIYSIRLHGWTRSGRSVRGICMCFVFQSTNERNNLYTLSDLVYVAILFASTNSIGVIDLAKSLVQIAFCY